MHNKRHLSLDLTDEGIKKENVVALGKLTKTGVIIYNYDFAKINQTIDMIYDYIEEVRKITENATPLNNQSDMPD